jgi:hypothetical protein
MLCTKATIAFAAHAIGLYNDAVCQEFNGLLATYVAINYNTQSHAYECKIHDDKFLGVTRMNGRVFVVLQKKDENACVVNSIWFNTFEWFELVKVMPHVNNFLASLMKNNL